MYKTASPPLPPPPLSSSRAASINIFTYPGHHPENSSQSISQGVNSIDVLLYIHTRTHIYTPTGVTTDLVKP